MMLTNLLFPFLVALQIVAAQNDACFNAPSQSQAGYCINIHSCPPVLALLREKPLRPETIKKLQNSQCGFDNTTPKVCCPNGGTTATPFRPTETTQLPPPQKQQQVVRVGLNHPKVRLLPVNACGINAFDDRIVNGKKAGLAQFPWMARIGYQTRTGESYRCGGSLISKRYVLTAAHCITNLPQSLRLSSVLLGETDALTNPDCEMKQGFQVCMPSTQSFNIERFISHPQYSPTTVQNDIGLIRLDRDADLTVVFMTVDACNAPEVRVMLLMEFIIQPVPVVNEVKVSLGEYDNSVRAICLPIGRIQMKNLDLVKEFTVAGWGTTENGTSSTSLLFANVPPVTNERCKTIYQRQASIVPSQLCAGGLSQDSCDGDSGGPLTMLEETNDGVRETQVGIVSFGPVRCASQGQPGVYTRVGHYLGWIMDNIQP